MVTSSSTIVQTIWGFIGFAKYIKPLPGGQWGAMENFRRGGHDKTRFVFFVRSLGAGV